MPHFLAQIHWSHPNAPQKDSLKDTRTEFLQERGYRELASGYGQWYGIIETEHDRFRVLLELALHLAPEDRLGVAEIPATDVPGDREDGREWVQAHEPFGTLVLAKEIAGARE